MTEEIFEKATRIQCKLKGVKKLKEVILNPNAPVMEAANALARYFQANPEEARKFVDDKIEALQKEFQSLCECEHCKFFQPKPEEKPEDPGDEQGEGEGKNNEPEDPEQPGENEGGEGNGNDNPEGNEKPEETTEGEGEETGSGEESPAV